MRKIRAVPNGRFAITWDDPDHKGKFMTINSFSKKEVIKMYKIAKKDKNENNMLLLSAALLGKSNEDGNT
jgi:hypothetical protein